MLKIKKIGFFFLFFLQILSGRSEGISIIDHQGNNGKDFYVLTIPRSGSHLILKMLTMLTNKTHVFPAAVFPQLNAFTFINENPHAFISNQGMEDAFASWKRANQFPLAHFNFSENFDQFSLKNPEYVKIIQIRDLRDVCVSCAHLHAQQIEQEIGPCTFDEKLMFIMILGDRATNHAFLRIEKNARLAVKYLQDPNAVICRFENLIGVNGGGSLENQIKQIVEIANGLGTEINSSKLYWITQNLFGIAKGPQIPSTFREGQIGSWRNYFKEGHKKAFNEIFGPLQTALGYTLEVVP